MRLHILCFLTDFVCYARRSILTETTQKQLDGKGKDSFHGSINKQGLCKASRISCFSFKTFLIFLVIKYIMALIIILAQLLSHAATNQGAPSGIPKSVWEHLNTDAFIW